MFWRGSKIQVRDRSTRFESQRSATRAKKKRWVLGGKANKRLVLDKKKRKQVLLIRVDHLRRRRADTQRRTGNSTYSLRDKEHIRLRTRSGRGYRTADESGGQPEQSTPGPPDLLLRPLIRLEPSAIEKITARRLQEWFPTRRPKPCRGR